jgi:predicted small metal-binding protein
MSFVRNKYWCIEMTKKFACKNIGLDCAFNAEAESEEQLMAKVSEHAKIAHGMAQIDEPTKAKIKAAITE